MRNKILNTIRRYNMLGDSSNIVVAVSGGADSMCLLHFLCGAKDELNINRIIAAHVNHNIRGEEAKRDELFVKDFCDKNNIQFELLDADIPEIAKKNKTGTEETARNIRYDYFTSLCEKYNAVAATAHNANDNAETVIYNLSRGSALKGLCGIPPKRNCIIRPLIECSREEIEDYCRENRLSYVTDSTNLTDDYTRNKIRHSVLPVLKELNPALEHSITRTVQTLKNDESFLLRLAEEELARAKTDGGYCVKALQRLDIAVLSRAVIILLSRAFDVQPDYDTVMSICGAVNSSSRVRIKNGICADANSGIFRLYKLSDNRNKGGSACAAVFGCEKAQLNGVTVEFSVLDKKEFDKAAKFNNLLFKNSVDYDIINAVTVIRTRKTGDMFTPKNRRFTKSLKKFLIDEKVLSEKRDSLLLLAQENEVLWLEGFGASQRAGVTKNTERVLTVSVKQNSSGENN